MYTATTATDAHILVYAYPASSHIIPLLDLTHRLLHRGHTITVVVLPTDLPLLQPLLYWTGGEDYNGDSVPLPLKSKLENWKISISLSRLVSLSLSLKSTIIYALCFKADNHQTWSSLSKTKRESLCSSSLLLLGKLFFSKIQV